MKTGETYTFTPTGMKITLAKVTEKNVSWYVGFTFKGGSGKNNLKMATLSIKLFNEGIKNGDYLLNH